MRKLLNFTVLKFLYSAMRNMAYAFVRFVSHKLHLKTRYYLTRQNKLRVRYFALTCLLLVFGSIGFLVSAQRSKSVGSTQVSEIEPAAGNVSDKINDALFNMAPSAEISLSALLPKMEEKPQPPPLDREVTIQSGDALSTVMEGQGVGNTDTQSIIKAMKPHFDPRGIRVGQKVAMHFDEVKDADVAELPDGQQLREVKIKLNSLKTLVVARAGDNFKAHIDEKAVEKKLRAKQAEIEVSLSGSAAKAGIPASIVAEAIRIYSWNVDFQRDIRAKDKIEVLYESYETEEGNIAKTGDILYAKLTLGSREIPLYRFKMSGGRVDYFGPDGISIKRTLMKTPINGARMSSGYGRRRHPVLGYTKMHKGADFAAPTGTPIFAAGDGVVEKSGWFSSYGKYVRIRHNSKLKTAYAHMSNIKSTVKPGKRVTQGQVIGYVGTTGRSTGPHLHYEVLKNGVQVNPRSINLPTGEELGGKNLARFKGVVSDYKRKFASSLEGTKLASIRGMFSH